MILVNFFGKLIPFDFVVVDFQISDMEDKNIGRIIKIGKRVQLELYKK